MILPLFRGNWAPDISPAPLRAVRALCNPFLGCWRDLQRPLTLAEVAKQLAKGGLDLEPPAAFGAPPLRSELAARLRHARKVAWFVQNGFEEPLSVDVGVPEMGCIVGYPVADGNHRLAAMNYVDDALGVDPGAVPLDVSGSLAHAERLGLLTARPARRRRLQATA